jgi:hypothetical protein
MEDAFEILASTQAGEVGKDAQTTEWGSHRVPSETGNSSHAEREK